MPQAGISVETCIIGTWKKKVGDKVAMGEALFNYETDKAEFDCESTAEGTLLEIFFQDGEEVPVLTAVCAIGNEGEDVSSLRPSGAGAAAPAAEAAAPAAAAPAAAAAVTKAADDGLHISPRAKNLAAGQNVDLRMVEPTGPNGRIIERDVRTAIDKGYIATGAAAGAVAAAGAGSFAGTGIGGRISIADLANPILAAEVEAAEIPEYEEEAFSKIRCVISSSMSESLATIPQLTHNFSFNASNIKAYRAQLKAAGEDLGVNGITLGDMIMYAVSRIILKYPNLNAHMIDATHIRKYNVVHLGFACDTPRGLMVPVIKYANYKTLAQISAEVKELAGIARNGNLSPDRMSGATFTISNLGSFGVESFTPVINAPQTGILGVDTIVNRPIEKNGEISLYPAMGLSLTYDHRAIDGAPASRFVQEVCKYLENFSVLLAK